LNAYFSAVWQCRYFWMSLVRMDLRTRYRRSILGLGWSLLNPISMTIVICLFFHGMMQMQVKEFAPYLMAGLATWTYILTAALQGCQCFFQGESYIRQYPAPLAIYPLRTALGGTIHFFMALLVVLALAWGFNRIANPLSLFSLIPSLVLLFIFAWSLAVLLGCANVHFQDTQHLAEVGFQILFYATPIMYKPEILHGWIAWLETFNPIYYIIQLIREPILEGHAPSPLTYAVACSTIFVTLSVASITLSRLQRRLIFHL
jgi:lipopolysaccharide transport system permease protein